HTYFANDFYVHNDKGGDGVRSEFEDTALFETISTNENGYGEVTFQLPDNITSWRVTAKAIDTENLKAGVGISSVPVTLPIFADLVMNREYSVKDSPIVKLRAYGSELEEGDVVEFIVSAASLGLEKSDAIEGEAFQGSYFELPDLSLGTHEVTLYAESGEYKDALMEPIEVRGSRLKETMIELMPDVTEQTEFELSDETSSEVWFMDGGIGFHYCQLLNLLYSYGDRLDQRLSEVAASELLEE
ncbi:unnamed protein product, partial [marine sediment metagenome]